MPIYKIKSSFVQSNFTNIENIKNFINRHLYAYKHTFYLQIIHYWKTVYEEQKKLILKRLVYY